MGTKHTPGPWFVDDRDSNRQNGIVVCTGEVPARGMVTIAAIRNVGAPWPAAVDVDLANAALIAAAPDLLAACKLAAEAFVNHLDYDCDESSAEREAYRALQAAIAKAEGQQ